MKRRKPAGRPLYVETPRGIFTANGQWFHITKEKIENYAPGLLEELPLEFLVRDAETWLKSVDFVGVILFMLLAYLSNTYIAAIVILIFVPFWFFNKSAFVSYSVTRLLRLIEYDAIAFLVSVAVLSSMGIYGHYAGLAIGFVFFFFLKFGWFRMILEYLDRKRAKLPSLSDRLFKMIILKYAMHEGITLREIDKWESDIRNFINKKGKI